MSFQNESCGISKHCPFTLGLSNVSCKRTVFLFLISVKLCEDFCVIMKCTEVGPVPTLLVSFLQQGVASTGTSVGPLSTYLPEDLVGKILVMIRHFRFFMWNFFAFSKVKEILELSPSLQSTPDVLLGLCNIKTTEGRQLCAKALCNSIWNYSTGRVCLLGSCIGSQKCVRLNFPQHVNTQFCILIVGAVKQTE